MGVKGEGKLVVWATYSAVVSNCFAVNRYYHIVHLERDR